MFWKNKKQVSKKVSLLVSEFQNAGAASRCETVPFVSDARHKAGFRTETNDVKPRKPLIYKYYINHGLGFTFFPKFDFFLLPLRFNPNND